MLVAESSCVAVACTDRRTRRAFDGRRSRERSAAVTPARPRAHTTSAPCLAVELLLGVGGGAGCRCGRAVCVCDLITHMSSRVCLRFDNTHVVWAESMADRSFGVFSGANFDAGCERARFTV